MDQAIIRALDSSEYIEELSRKWMSSERCLQGLDL